MTRQLPILIFQKMKCEGKHLLSMNIGKNDNQKIFRLKISGKKKY